MMDSDFVYQDTYGFRRLPETSQGDIWRELTSTSHHLLQLSPPALWYPSSRHPLPHEASHRGSSHSAWAERKAQKRWLSKVHAQAFPAIAGLESLLLTETATSPRSTTTSSANRLLTLGEFINMGNPDRSSLSPLLAMATGLSGDTLRLVKPSATEMSFIGVPGVSVPLAAHETKEEAFWSAEGGPILHVKFASCKLPFYQTHWLLIQKSQSTTILEPEYHRAPVSVSTSEAFPKVKALSRIYPNPIVSIPASETGGNAHCDVSFNPAKPGSPPQVAIIDGGGYWSVWDIFGSKTRLHDTRRAILSLGGDFSSVLSKLPSYPVQDRRWRRILWIGEPYDLDDPEQPPSDVRIGKLDSVLSKSRSHSWLLDDENSRSKILLLCQEQELKAVNVETGKFLAVFSFDKVFDAGTLIDVHRNPIKPSEVLLLTTKQFLWIDVLQHQISEDGSTQMSVVASHSFSSSPRSTRDKMEIMRHDRGESCDTVFVCIRSVDQGEAVLLQLSSPRNRNLRPRVFSSSVYLSRPSDTSSQMHSVCAATIPLRRQQSAASIQASSEMLGFKSVLQVFVLHENLSLAATTWTLSSKSTAPPTSLQILHVPSRALEVKQRRTGRRALRWFKQGFVVPDEFGDLAADFPRYEMERILPGLPPSESVGPFSDLRDHTQQFLRYLWQVEWPQLDPAQGDDLFGAVVALLRSETMLVPMRTL